MKFLILRKRHIWEKYKREKISLNDIEIEIVYVLRPSKKVMAEAEKFDCVLSTCFKEFFKEGGLMKLFTTQSFDKIASRHGNADKDILEVQVDILNEENAKILVELSLNARYVILHSSIDMEKFDFLCEEAGVCPEVAFGQFKQNMVVYLGEEFLIKHLPAGKTYYDILLKLPDEFDEYFLPEANMIFSEYIKENPLKRQNVKIRELMSK